MPLSSLARGSSWFRGGQPRGYETTGQGAPSQHRLAGRLKDIVTRTFREKERQMKPRLCIAIACAIACVTCVRNSQAPTDPTLCARIVGARRRQRQIGAAGRVHKQLGCFQKPSASEGSLGVARNKTSRDGFTSKRRRRWLHRLRAECPGGVALWAANFRYSELPCILPVTDFLVLRARQ
jgi:hypothetical protein